MVQLGSGARTLPNYLATQIELFDGLVGASVNAWPSVDFDLRAVNGLASRFLPPGLLLQDLHVAEAALALLRAAAAQGGWLRRRAFGARPRPLRQDERPLRRAGGLAAVPRDWLPRCVPAALVRGSSS